MHIEISGWMHMYWWTSFFLLYMWIYGNLMNGCMCMYEYMDMIFKHNMLWIDTYRLYFFFQCFQCIWAYIYSIHMYEWCCQKWMLWNNSLYMSFVLGWVRLRMVIVRMFGLTLLSTKGIMGVLPRMDRKQALASSYSCYCIFLKLKVLTYLCHYDTCCQ